MRPELLYLFQINYLKLWRSNFRVGFYSERGDEDDNCLLPFAWLLLCWASLFSRKLAWVCRRKGEAGVVRINCVTFSHEHTLTHKQTNARSHGKAIIVVSFASSLTGKRDCLRVYMCLAHLPHRTALSSLQFQAAMTVLTEAHNLLADN